MSKYEQLMKEREKQNKIKVDQIKNIITTIKSKPKFVNLLNYSLNSMDVLISPPNREIRLNSKLIIENEGVESLKLIIKSNMYNEEVTEKCAMIIIKLIGDPVDKSIIEKMVEGGLDTVISELLLTKDPSSKNTIFADIIRKFASVPQVLPNMIDKGLVETTKLVNDLYENYQEIILINCDTIRMISSTKKGREILISKGILSNLLSKAEKFAENKNEEAVLSILQTIDNLTRDPNGAKELELKKNQLKLQKIGNLLSRNKEIKQMSSKILSKVVNESDLQSEIDRLIELNKTLVDNGELSKEDNEKLSEIVQNIYNLIPIQNSKEIIERNLDFFKEFYQKNQLFKRNNENPDEFKSFLKINSNLLKILEVCKDNEKLNDKQINKDIIDSLSDLTSKYENFKDDEEALNLYREIFNSSIGLLTNYLTNPIFNLDNKEINPAKLALINQGLNLVKNCPIHLEEGDVFTEAASKLLSLASQLRKDFYLDKIFTDDKIRTKLNTIFNYPSFSDFIIKAINISTNAETFKNLVNSLINNLGIEFDKDFAAKMLVVMVKSLEEKYNNKEIVTSILTFIKFLVDKPEFIDYYNKEKKNKDSCLFELDIVFPIVKSITQDSFGTVTEINTVKNVEKDKSKIHKTKMQQDEELFNLGGNILEKLVNEDDIKRLMSTLEKEESNFKPESTNLSSLSLLEDTLKSFIVLSSSNKLVCLFLKDLLKSFSTLVKKDLTYNEFNKPKEESKVMLLKRINLYKSLCLRINIKSRCLLKNNIREQFKVSEGDVLNSIDSSLDLLLSILKKINDEPIQEDIINNLIDIVDFYSEDNKVTVNNDEAHIEKICNAFVGILRTNTSEKISLLIYNKIINLIERNPNIINTFVKCGLISVLLNNLENGINIQISEKILILLGYIARSNENNLKLLASQNCLSKLYKYGMLEQSNMSKYINPIIKELLKLPISDSTIMNNVKNDISNGGTQNNEELMNYLKTLNLFTTDNDENLVKDDLFNSIITILNNQKSNKDKDSQEEIINLCLPILSKIVNKLKELPTEKKTERVEKILSSLNSLLIKVPLNEELISNIVKSTEEVIKESIDLNISLSDKVVDKDYVDYLFDILDNSLNNSNLQNDINNLISLISHKFNHLLEHIIKHGGLKKILDELKYLINAENKEMYEKRTNLLKFLGSLLNKKNILDEFMSLKGVSTIDRIIQSEVFHVDQNIPNSKQFLSKLSISSPLIEGNNNLFSVNDSTDTQYLTILSSNSSLSSSYVEFLNQTLQECINIYNIVLSNGNKLLIESYKDLPLLLISSFPSYQNFKSIIEMMINPSSKIINNLSPIKKVILIQYFLSGEYKFSEYSRKKIVDEERSEDQQIQALSINENYLKEQDIVDISSLLKQLEIKEEKEAFDLIFKSYINYNKKNSCKQFFDYDNIDKLERFIVFTSLSYSKNLHSLQDKTDSIRLFIDEVNNKEAYKNFSPLGKAYYLILVKDISQHLNQPPSEIFSDKKILDKLIKEVLPYMNMNNKEYINLINQPIKDALALSFNKSGNVEERIAYFTEQAQMGNRILRKIYRKITKKEVKYDPYIGNFVNDNLNTFYSLPIDQEARNNITHDYTETSLGFINSNELELKDKIAFWEMQNQVLENDLSKEILKDEVLSRSLLDSIGNLIEETKRNKSNPDIYNKLKSILNKVFVNATNQFGSSDEYSGEIANYLSKMDDDLLDNDSLLKSYANLSKSIIAQKILLKSNKFFKNLNENYKNEKNKSKVLSIISPFMINSLNAEMFLNGNMNLIQELISEMKNKDQFTKEEEELLFYMLSNKDIVNKLLENNILTNTEILALINKISDEKIKEKLQNEYANTSNVNSAKAIPQDIDDLEELISGYLRGDLSNTSKLMNNVSGFRRPSEIKNVLDDLNKNQGRLSKLIDPEGLKSIYNNITESALSLSQNENIIPIIDKVCVGISNQFEKLKKSVGTPEENEELLKFKKYLKVIIKLALHPDNHRYIYETGVVDIIQNAIFTDFKYDDEIKNDSTEIIKLITTTPAVAQQIVKQEFTNLLFKDYFQMMKNIKSIKDSQKVCLLNYNSILSNFCKDKRSFENILVKLGFEKLIKAFLIIDEIELLEILQETIISYLELMSKEQANYFFKDISIFSAKCATINRRTSKMLKNSFYIVGGCIDIINKAELTTTFNPIQRNTPNIELYKELHIVQSINEMIKESNKEIKTLTSEFENLKSVLFFLSRICTSLSFLIEISNTEIISSIVTLFNSNTIAVKSTIRGSLLKSTYTTANLIKDTKPDSFVLILDSLDIIDAYTFLISNYISIDNSTFKKLIELGLADQIVKIIIISKEKGEKLVESQLIESILYNSLCIFNKISEFSYSSLPTKENNILLILINLFDKYKYSKDLIIVILKAIHHIVSHDTSQRDDNEILTMINLLGAGHKIYYSLVDILILVNSIAYEMINKSTKNKELIIKAFKIIVSSIYIQEDNSELLIFSLNLIKDLLKKPYLAETLVEVYIQTFIKLLESIKDKSEAIKSICEILSLLIDSNPKNAYFLISKNVIFSLEILMDHVDANFYKQNNDKSIIQIVVFKLFYKIIQCKESSFNYNTRLVKYVIDRLNSDDKFLNETSKLIIMEVVSNPLGLDYLLQFEILDKIISCAKQKDQSQVDLDFLCKTVKALITSSNDHKDELLKLGALDLFNLLINKYGSNKKFEFEAKSIVFILSKSTPKLDVIDKVQIEDVKLESSLKQEIKNFLISGKIVTYISEKGKVKQKHLSFSSDLLRILIKHPKELNLPPKPKYTIEASSIKQIIRGHGTEAFKKSKSLFRSLPDPKKCFTVIGPTTVDGLKTFNIECENENDAEKWMNSLEAVIVFLRKTKIIKNNVLIKK